MIALFLFCLFLVICVFCFVDFDDCVERCVFAFVGLGLMLLCFKVV